VIPTGAVGSTRPVAFRPDGRVLAMIQGVDRRDVVHLVDPVDGRVLAALQPPEPLTISGLRSSLDGTRLAVATMSHRIQVWDLRRIAERLSSLGLGAGLPPGLSSASQGVRDDAVEMTVDL